MSVARQHADWMNLIEINGPFLSLPVAMKVFPQGLPTLDAETNKNLRLAFETWDDKREESAPLRQWVQHVLQTFLEIPCDAWKEGQSLPPGLEAAFPEYGETLRPDLALVAPSGEGKQIVRLLVQIVTDIRDLNSPLAGRRWKASPATRMMELLHATGTVLGLVTNGRQWMLVYAPAGETSGFITWYSHLWIEEQITVRAFRALFHCSRFFSVPEGETLLGMLKESAQDQQEVTDQLGRQVRKAVEVLVQAFDRLDHEAGGTLLGEVQPSELYEAVLTVMMRLVFLFSAEERDLLRLGEPLYDDNYAVSTLRDQLRESADRFGEEVLERRFDAWGRLLAAFRVVHGGVEHESLRLPPYGGSLFDPDRYAFLEGRKAGSAWKSAPSHPPAINNRVVLHLMESLQTLQMKVPGSKATETRKLSFRALDIEQIGHVYEGLLDHTAVRATETVLGLVGAKNQEEEIFLRDLEDRRSKGISALVTFLHDTTGRSEKTLEKLFSTYSEPAPYGKKEVQARNRLQAILPGNSVVRQQVEPYIDLVREDSFGMPLVIEAGRIYVTHGATRRSTGTHYTPRSLTEPIVQHTLEPLVYCGPAEGWPKEKWELKKPAEILELKICDMAMGSGAFLVQVCRYMSERLVEAWEAEEQAHPGKQVISPDGTLSSGKPDERLIPRDLGERLAIARRAVVDRCIYGVDINPVAVEMAKLSMWLITMQRDRPFTFLDHAFKCGDSLVGVTSLEQIERFSLRPNQYQSTFAMKDIKTLVDDAAAKRQKLEMLPSNDHTQVEEKNRIHCEVQGGIAELKALADCLISFELKGFEGKQYEEQRVIAAGQAEAAMRKPLREFKEYALEQLHARRTFHWPVEFAEITAKNGFDGFVGNPPFRGGLMITKDFELCYTLYLKMITSNAGATTDLCAYFFRRIFNLLRGQGVLGLLATNSICEGNTRETALEEILKNGGSICRAIRSLPWPGTAALHIAVIHIVRGQWLGGKKLDGVDTASISSSLSSDNQLVRPKILAGVTSAFLGTTVYGRGFFLSNNEAQHLIAQDPACKSVIKPFLNGDDVMQNPSPNPSRFVLYFQGKTVDEAARFGPAFALAKERAFPERQKSSSKRRREMWWLYTSPAEDLYQAVRMLRFVFVTCFVSKYIVFVKMDTDMIFSNTVIVVASDDYGCFSALQSSYHEAWVREYSSTLETRQRYALSDCYDTFPPPRTSDRMREVGHAYHRVRVELMTKNNIGLTDLYNRYHDRNEKSEDIFKLRALHVEMNQVVAAAYGWSDLDLGHGFYETKQGVRFTISESARRIVLDRLLALNHQRYEEEVKAGLHDKKKKPAAKGCKKKSDTEPTLSYSAPALPGFDEDDD
ncbi:MAG: DNA methyltransferase [Candidatus Ozemobacteraceae bacterium]